MEMLPVGDLGLEADRADGLVLAANRFDRPLFLGLSHDLPTDEHRSSESSGADRVTDLLHMVGWNLNGPGRYGFTRRARSRKIGSVGGMEPIRLNSAGSRSYSPPLALMSLSMGIEASGSRSWSVIFEK
jgi:hypothetical protein